MLACEREEPFTEKDIPDLGGYVAIVTGGNGGLGYETSKQLTRKNARVYIAARSEERAKSAIEQMTLEAGRSLDLHFLLCDLQDLKSVKECCSAFSQKESRLDILINNAGVMSCPYKLTTDGFETQWQVNYLAPFIMTTCLLPLMLSTAATSDSKTRVRIVNVSSALAFSNPKTIDFEDPNLTNASGMLENQTRYSHSKQASIRHAKEINDRFASQGVTAYSLHPGVISTNLQDANPTFMGSLTKNLVRMASRTTPLEGSLNSLFCATSPLAPERGQGLYFEPVGQVKSKGNRFTDDKEVNLKLWKESEAELVKLM